MREDGGSVRVLGVDTLQSFHPEEYFKTPIQQAGAAAPVMHELESSVKAATAFRDRIAKSKEGNPHAAAVEVKTPEEYQATRLFMNEEGTSGFALKGDDIVSVFNYGEKGSAAGMLQLAIQEGGRRLDAFDTILPKLYAAHGFKAVARVEWNNEFAPPGWNKNTFEKFNNGEPDIVLMTYDPHHFGEYEPGDGKQVSDWDAGVALQDTTLKSVAESGEKGYGQNNGQKVNSVIDAGTETDGGPDSRGVSGPATGHDGESDPGGLRSVYGKVGSFPSHLGGRDVRPATYGKASDPGVVTVHGVHYSRERRSTLHSDKHGTGLSGAERKYSLKDPVLSHRINFYVDMGNGIRPEAGVGNVPHPVTLNAKFYDIRKDPQGIFKQWRESGSRDVGDLERSIIDAGHDGVINTDWSGRMGTAILIGKREIPLSETQESPLESAASRNAATDSMLAQEGRPFSLLTTNF